MKDSLRKDIVIIGQGIAGSALALSCIKRGMSVLIIDSGIKNTSSRVAGALINPIVIKRLNLVHRAAECLSEAHKFYTSLESTDTKIWFPKAVYRIFPGKHEVDQWMQKCVQPDTESWLDKDIKMDGAETYYINENGSGKINHTAWIDAALCMDILEQKFTLTGSLMHKTIDYNDIEITEEGFRIDKVTAGKLIFSEGHLARFNPYFRHLPFNPCKGEVLQLETTVPVPDFVAQRDAFITPVGPTIVKCGSTYEWDDLSPEPTESGASILQKKADQLLRLPYKVTGHVAGIRPSTDDRRPYLGEHPEIKGMFIFNGLGTRGYLLAPLYAEEMADHILNNKPIDPEADIRRYERFYSPVK